MISLVSWEDDLWPWIVLTTCLPVVRLLPKCMGELGHDPPFHLQRAVKGAVEQPTVLSICSCRGRYSLTGLSNSKFTPDLRGLERQHLSWEGTEIKTIAFWRVNLRHVSILASRRNILLRTNSWNRNVELAWLWRTQCVSWELPTASLSQKNGTMVVKNVRLSF